MSVQDCFYVSPSCGFQLHLLLFLGHPWGRPWCGEQGGTCWASCETPPSDSWLPWWRHWGNNKQNELHITVQVDAACNYIYSSGQTETSVVWAIPSLLKKVAVSSQIASWPIYCRWMRVFPCHRWYYSQGEWTIHFLSQVLSGIVYQMHTSYEMFLGCGLITHSMYTDVCLTIAILLSLYCTTTMM